MTRPELTSDISERGESIYAEVIRPKLTAQDQGKFVVIAVTTGEYTIDSEHLRALEKMLTRHPGDSLYSIRIGFPAAYQLGAHNMTGAA